MTPASKRAKTKRPSDLKLTTKLDNVVRDILHAQTKELKCFVCGRETDWFSPKTNPYGLQVGHFISRSVFPLRWDLKNCEPVCSSCNYVHENNTLPHMMAIMKTYGMPRLDYLNEKFLASKQKAKSFTRGEKLELLEQLEELLTSLKGK